MAAPVDDSYSAASGQGIYGGKFNWPVWRRAVAAQTVAEIGANMLSNVDPKFDAAVNPNYPLNAPWTATTGFTGLLAYSGGCFDDVGSVFHLPLQGGHADYAGNEPYKIDLSQDNPTWVRLRNPSGAIGNLGTLNDGQESTGLYFDGRARAIHSYNKPVCVPGVGPIISVQGSTSYSGQAGISRTLFINEVTGEVDLFGAINGFAGTTSGGGCCYDPSRHAIWFRGVGTGYYSRYDIATNTWYRHGVSGGGGGYNSLTYLPDHDCIVRLDQNLASGFEVFDCATNITHTTTKTGTAVGTVVTGHAQGWLIDGNKIAWWHNLSDTATINTIEFSSNPRTDVWTIDQLTFSGVTPTVRRNSGTFGRFFYSSKLDGFGLINAVNQKMYFFARS